MNCQQLIAIKSEKSNHNIIPNMIIILVLLLHIIIIIIIIIIINTLMYYLVKIVPINIFYRANENGKNGGFDK